MDDLISRKATIDALNNVLADYIPCLIGRNEGIPLKCAVAIRDLPSAQRWIPCKTALPKYDGEYLVTKKSFGWNCTEYIETDIARYEKKDGWHKAYTVLAWCELPTPWEGGEYGTHRTVLPKESLR